MEASSENKRIVRNTVFLTMRMIVVLFVTLYTTRKTLAILGIEDYGIYNVVCGFVSMFAFLNTSMSNGVQRFLNYEIGKHDKDKFILVFNSAIIIQFILVVLVVILTETVGLWYINNKLNISADRIYAAKMIFQLAILSFVFVIMQVPYSAAIMAYERMDYYAIVSVLNAVFKLGIVLLIPFLNGDRLILYGILLSLIGLINFCLYAGYVKINFKHLSFHFRTNKALFLSMISFSGWNIFGSFAGVIKDQGTSLVLNFFYGPIVNAARGVANQVSGGLMSFVSTLSTAVRPQLIQSYAGGDINRSLRLTYSISKFGVYILYMLALPIILEIKWVLSIWLGNNVPDHTSSFIIIVLLIAFISILNAAISNIVHASGVMRKYQVTTSLITITCIPIAYFLLKKISIPELALWSCLFSSAISHIAALFIVKGIIKFSIYEYIKKVIKPITLVILLSVLIPCIVHSYLHAGFLRFACVFISHLICSCSIIYFIGVDIKEKEFLNKIVLAIINKWTKK